MTAETNLIRFHFLLLLSSRHRLTSLGQRAPKSPPASLLRPTECTCGRSHSRPADHKCLASGSQAPCCPQGQEPQLPKLARLPITSQPPLLPSARLSMPWDVLSLFPSCPHPSPALPISTSGLSFRIVTSRNALPKPASEGIKSSSTAFPRILLSPQALRHSA